MYVKCTPTHNELVVWSKEQMSLLTFKVSGRVLPKIQREYKYTCTFWQPKFVCIHHVYAAFFHHINMCNIHLAFYVSYYTVCFHLGQCYVIVTLTAFLLSVSKSFLEIVLFSFTLCGKIRKLLKSTTLLL